MGTEILRMYLAEVVRPKQRPSRSPGEEERTNAERRGCYQESDEVHSREERHYHGRMACLGEAGRQMRPLKPGDKRK